MSFYHTCGFLWVLPWWLRGKESACNAEDTGDVGSILESGKSPVGGNGNILQCSCLRDSMDRGARQATVHRVAKSWTWLNMHIHIDSCYYHCCQNTKYICACVFMYPRTCTFIHLCPTLCDPRDSSPPGLSEHEIFQVGILDPVVISYSRGSSQPRGWTCLSWSIAHKFLTTMSHLLQWETSFLGAPESLKMVTAAMKLKDACSLEEKLWPT